MRTRDALVERVLDATEPREDEKNVIAFHMPKKLDRDQLPRSLQRAKSAQGLFVSWRKLRDAVWTAGGIPYKRLPQFAYEWGHMFYMTHERRAYDALCLGDVMFFEAWFGRFSMMEAAAVEKKMSIKERSTILHALGILKGYSDAAAIRLRDLGGKWPPESAA